MTTFLKDIIPILNQSAIFVGVVVGFLNVLLPGVHPPRGYNKKTIHFLTGELRYGGVAHIRLVASA
jgi:hypothetical protein